MSTLATTLLYALGLRTPKRLSLLLLGLDNAGKTTLLHRLQNPSAPASAPFLKNCTPSFFPSTEDNLHIDLDDYPSRLVLRVFDLPGHVQARRLWRDSLLADMDVDGVVFVVDSADSERFGEAREVLEGILKALGGNNGRGESSGRGGVPVVVWGSKADVEGAVRVDGLREAFGLGKGEGEDGRSLGVFVGSSLAGTGYRDALGWLVMRTGTR
ncbi:GTP-binding protein sarA [Echria macrotheca]|uniref:GTP-binding protein sarA n=1 Tax=Echria macrotheca TaxID=438768 RepID=A0AAJ0BDZ5_9PEZI|nr:GTP-binding protein sarA [Echria macrotheca]